MIGLGRFSGVLQLGICDICNRFHGDSRATPNKSTFIPVSSGGNAPAKRVKSSSLSFCFWNMGLLYITPRSKGST